MAVSGRTSAFQKIGPETPVFIVFFWVRVFWAKVSKKGILKNHPRKKKNLTDN